MVYRPWPRAVNEFIGGLPTVQLEGSTGFCDMSGLSLLKRTTISTGLYRPARFLYRHLLKRKRLHEFRRDTAFFSQMVEPGSLCFDVGANIGEKTEALLAAGARVVAFEPQPDCVAELKARCGHRPQFTVCQAALGSQVGESTLYIHRSNTSSSLDPQWGGSYEHPIRVPVTTLDHAIGEFGGRASVRSTLKVGS